MSTKWIFMAIVAFFVVLIIVLLILKNRKDEKEVEKYFTEQFNTERKFEPSDNDQEESETLGS